MTGQHEHGEVGRSDLGGAALDAGAPGRRRPEAGEPLAALTGSGSSVVGVEGALRARDVSRPTPVDLAAAAKTPVRRATARPGEN